MPKPSEWLHRVEPAALYIDTKLLELGHYGITYDMESGQLMSKIHEGHPYSTFGRLTSVERLTAKQAMMKARMYGLDMESIDGRHDDPDARLVFGYAIVAAVWGVLHNIIDMGPPSRLVEDPNLKAELDLEAIKEYGY